MELMDHNCGSAMQGQGVPMKRPVKAMKQVKSDEASKNDEGQAQGKGDEGCQAQAHEEGSAETVAEATAASENR